MEWSPLLYGSGFEWSGVSCIGEMQNEMESVALRGGSVGCSSAWTQKYTAFLGSF